MERETSFLMGVAITAFLALSTTAAFGQRAAMASRVVSPRATSAVAARANATRPNFARHADGQGSNGGSFPVIFSSSNGIRLSPVPLGTQTASILARNQGIEGAIDPSTQWRLELAQRFLRENQGVIEPEFFLADSGYPYVIPESDGNNGEQSTAPQSPQPQIIVLQQASAAGQTASPSAQENIGASSLRDEGMFTIVLRNGTQIQAAAFTRLNGKIIYITPDGARRAISNDEIDSDATLRLNQERGIPVSL